MAATFKTLPQKGSLGGMTTSMTPMTGGLSVKGAVDPSLKTGRRWAAGGGSAGGGMPSFPAGGPPGVSPMGGGIGAAGLPGAGAAPSLTTVAPNPFQTEAYADLKKYLEGLPGATDAYSEGALARQRDLVSSGLSDVRKAAGARGFGIDSGVNTTLQTKAAQSGQALLAGMGQDLANKGRELTLTGLTSQGNLGSNIAAQQTAQQNALVSLYAAQQQAALAAWQAQQSAMQNQWDNYFKLYSSPMYTTNR